MCIHKAIRQLYAISHNSPIIGRHVCSTIFIHPVASNIGHTHLRRYPLITDVDRLPSGALCCAPKAWGRKRSLPDQRPESNHPPKYCKRNEESMSGAIKVVTECKLGGKLRSWSVCCTTINAERWSVWEAWEKVWTWALLVIWGRKGPSEPSN